jgi:hypothetical protein
MNNCTASLSLSHTHTEYRLAQLCACSCNTSLYTAKIPLEQQLTIHNNGTMLIISITEFNSVLNYLHVAESLLRNLFMLRQLSRYTQNFMGFETSLQCPLEPATGPYSV